MANNKKKSIWVHPCVECGCDCNEIEDDHYHIFLELPGVKKEDINLQIIKDGMRLRAMKGSDIEYISELKFLCDANPNEVKTNYDNGLLSIDIPFACPDPFKGSDPIKIK